MHWRLSHRFDARALPLANRHYNRQSPDSPQFCPPGRCIVLLTPEADALWVSSWPYAEFTRHAWAGAWVNTLFRNESTSLASDLIRDAMAATIGIWGEPPSLGMITFIDAGKIRPKPLAGIGRCYRKAGFNHVGHTRGGLHAFQILPDAMPAPQFLQHSQTELLYAQQ